MNKIKIEDYKIIHDIPPVLPEKDENGKPVVCAIDTEWAGMDIKKKAHRPHGIFLCCTFYFGTDEVYIVENPKDLIQAFENVKKCGWVFHNAAFDIVQLRRFVFIPTRKALWDTQLVEQVMYSGRYAEYNLAACARRHLDLYVDKDERETFETHTGEMTKEQVEYSCKDPIITYLLYKAQRSIIDRDDLKVWYEIELPYMWVILGKSGMKINVDAWQKLSVSNKERADAIQEKYGKKVPKIGKKGLPLKSLVWEGLNLRSNPEVLAYMKSLGIDAQSTGKDALALIDKITKDTDDEDVEDEAILVTHPFIQDLIDFRKYDTRVVRYGQKWLDQWIEDGDKVYPGILQRQAGTSRQSSRNPNGQNIPHRDTNEYRECFIAGEGKKIVVADYSTQEPRIVAQFSADENLIRIFKSGNDFYIEAARESFNEIIDKKSPRRGHMKKLTLATLYQEGKKKLAQELGTTEDEAMSMLNAFYAAFPMVKVGYVQPSQKMACEYGYVTTLSKSKLWVNCYAGGGAPGRHAVNYRIQGSGAEMLKRASVEFTRRWDGENFCDNIAFLLPVHDEIVLCVDADKAEDAKNLLVECMESVAREMHPLVPAKVEAFVGDSWGAKT